MAEKGDIFNKYVEQIAEGNNGSIDYAEIKHPKHIVSRLEGERERLDSLALQLEAAQKTAAQYEQPYNPNLESDDPSLNNETIENMEPISSPQELKDALGRVTDYDGLKNVLSRMPVIKGSDGKYYPPEFTLALIVAQKGTISQMYVSNSGTEANPNVKYNLRDQLKEKLGGDNPDIEITGDEITSVTSLDEVTSLEQFYLSAITEDNLLEGYQDINYIRLFHANLDAMNPNNRRSFIDNTEKTKVIPKEILDLFRAKYKIDKESVNTIDPESTTNVPEGDQVSMNPTTDNETEDVIPSTDGPEGDEPIEPDSDTSASPDTKATATVDSSPLEEESIQGYKSTEITPVIEEKLKSIEDPNELIAYIKEKIPFHTGADDMLYSKEYVVAAIFATISHNGSENFDVDNIKFISNFDSRIIKAIKKLTPNLTDLNLPSILGNKTSLDDFIYRGRAFMFEGEDLTSIYYKLLISRTNILQGTRDFLYILNGESKNMYIIKSILAKQAKSKGYNLTVDIDTHSYDQNTKLASLRRRVEELLKNKLDNQYTVNT